MEEKKKNLVIAILSVVIVLLVAFIALVATDTISFKSNDVDNNVTDNNENTQNGEFENNNDVDWSSHLLSLHLLDSKVTRMRSVDLGDSEDINKTATISKEELNSLLDNLKDKKLVKTYSQGRGGPDRDHLVVAYEYNDEKYEFEIFAGSISVDKLDENFKKILNDNNYEEKGTEYKGMEGTFYYYAIDGYSESIFDEYFR